MKKLFIISALIVLVSVFGYMANKNKAIDYPTYFSYTEDQKKTIKSAYSEITKETDVSDIRSWDETLFNFVKEKKLPPTHASRLYAYTLAAQREAAFLSFNIKNRFVGSFTLASAKVACVLYPSDCEIFMKDLLVDAYSETLASVVTEQFSKRFVAEAFESYIVLTGEAYWDGKNPVTPAAGSWKPWLMKNSSQFRAIPPPSYGLTEDLVQIAEVKKALANITAEQKEATTYWAGGAGTVTPSGIWLEIATKTAEAENMKLKDFLNLRADLTMTMADAFISCWDSKFSYWTKRPFMRDMTIKSIIPTPNFPGYPSGHSTISSATSVVLSHYFPSAKNEWIRMAEEARDTRLWSGIHFPIDNEVGFYIGQEIGKQAVSLLKERDAK